MADSLEQMRQQIDAADKKLIEALAQRMAVVKRVGEYKKIHNLSPLDPTRWEKVVQEKLKQAEKHGLSQDMVKDIYERIHKEALEIEKKI